MKINKTLVLAHALCCVAVASNAQSGFLTEPFGGEDTWSLSQWISVKDAPVVTEVVNDGVRAADGANWFISTVTNDKVVEKAEWMTAGLGVYDLYVNGELIGNEVLKPGFTHALKTKRSYTYNVTKVFNTKAGAENQLAVQVTPGWWADKIITPAGTKGMIGKCCAFRGILRLTYKDGTTQLLGTNTKDWKAGIAGPVTHAAIFDGEDYDARVKQGFETPEKMTTPIVSNEFKGQILPTNGAEIYMRHDLAIAPVKAYIWEGVTGATDDEYGTVIVKKEFKKNEKMTLRPGETLVVDFGQNCAGVPSFVFQAGEGTQLTCLPAELLNDGNGSKKRGMDGPEGSTHRLNLRIPETGMILRYTFAQSEKPVTFCPRSTFFGYRQVSITATGEVTISKIQSIPITSIAKGMEIGSITTGNELINKLISNTIWGQRSNYLSVTTDCPQRNERLGWTADTQVFTETGTFFANTSDFFHKWMQDMRDTQNDLGSYPGVAPWAQYGAASTDMGRVGWSDAGVIVPWTVWKQFGDKKIVEESWESMEFYMNHIAETKYDHQTMARENGNYQWADWLSYEPLESASGRIDGPNGHLPET
ncbi:MAG: family 78 glycoside hydrolase catalytic domain, partial [Bacteroidaceae bacterium]|nr:family 78 glycoside hydrolase catalytic domain [Bacteroidaceae bacterium]